MVAGSEISRVVGEFEDSDSHGPPETSHHEQCPAVRNVQNFFIDINELDGPINIINFEISENLNSLLTYSSPLNLKTTWMTQSSETVYIYLVTNN